MSVLIGPLKCPCRLNTRLRIAYEFLHWHVKTQYCIKHVIVGANCVDRRSEIFTSQLKKSVFYASIVESAQKDQKSIL